jgi:beta-phosphoglucomutase-like phosphatase (HAD superfamily)
LSDPATRGRVLTSIVPAGIAGCLFDLDGVLTQTAKLHAEAWKQMFDDFLRSIDGRGEPFHPFDLPDDYVEYVDGKLRPVSGFPGIARHNVARGFR